MENIVLVELLRRKDCFDKNLEIYYWQNYLGKEADFIIKEGKKIVQIIQVCVKISDYFTKEREINSLLKASEELKCNDLLYANATL